jgi:hypothetical protein
MKRAVTHLLVQIGVLIVVGVLSGFIALISIGVIGGTAMGVIPEFTFGLVEDYVCPGARLEYSSVQRSYHQPGESEPIVECVDEQGGREEALLPAITAVLVGTFLIVFLAIFLPGVILGSVIVFVMTRKALSLSQRGAQDT